MYSRVQQLAFAMNAHSVHTWLDELRKYADKDTLMASSYFQASGDCSESDDDDDAREAAPAPASNPDETTTDAGSKAQDSTLLLPPAQFRSLLSRGPPQVEQFDTGCLMNIKSLSMTPRLPSCSSEMLAKESEAEIPLRRISESLVPRTPTKAPPRVPLLAMQHGDFPAGHSSDGDRQRPQTCRGITDPTTCSSRLLTPRSPLGENLSMQDTISPRRRIHGPGHRDRSRLKDPLSPQSPPTSPFNNSIQGFRIHQPHTPNHSSNITLPPARVHFQSGPRHTDVNVHEHIY